MRGSSEVKKGQEVPLVMQVADGEKASEEDQVRWRLGRGRYHEPRHLSAV